MPFGVVRLPAGASFPVCGNHSDSSLVQKHPGRFELVEVLVAVKLRQRSTQHTISHTFSRRFAELCVDTSTVGLQIVFKSSLGYILACATQQPPYDCNLDITSSTASRLAL